MGVILILTVSLTLTFGSCKGVSILRKITITVDDATLDCLRAMREINGVPFSVAVRRAVWAYYKDMYSVSSEKK